MPKEAVKATPASAHHIPQLFDQAFQALGDSFKAAMKAQEDTVRLLTEAVDRANPRHAVDGHWIPAAEKNAEECLRLLESSYHRNADLLRKIIYRQNCGTGISVEKRTHDWLEASIALANANAQDLANTSLRVAQAWTEAFKKATQQAADTAKQAQRGARPGRPGHKGNGHTPAWCPQTQSTPKHGKAAASHRQTA